MKNYYFILGRENKISQMELRSILANFDFDFIPTDISIIAQDILEIKLAAPAGKVADLMNILGGTVKIFQKIAPREEKILTLLQNEEIDKKIIFGISNYSSDQVDTFRLAIKVKKALEKPLRVISGKENYRLSSAQSFQYKMDSENLEFGLFDTGIGKLIAVQNVDDWSIRDYEKPESDAKSGMLPPKLARMMVNIAVNILKVKPPLIVDPFCGSGNLLLEALILGYEALGIDISEKAISDSQKNINWLKANYNIKAAYELQLADAKKFDFGSLDRNFVVVSEPYLGQPRRAKLRLEEERQIKADLSDLYIDFLQNLKLTTKNSGLKAVLLIFPLLELANGKQLSIFEGCVDRIGEIGYTTVCPPLTYGRDYQVVKRELVILKQNGT